MDYTNSKFLRQIKAIETWFFKGGNGTLLHPTGFGKTMEGILAIKLIASKFTDYTIFILVTSDAGKKRWIEEINTSELLNQTHKDNIVLMSVEEASRNIDSPTNITLLIIDEIHKFSSDKRIELLDKSLIIPIYSIALTATYIDDASYFGDFLRNNYPIVDNISKKEAEINNWITPTIEFAIAVELTDDERIKYKLLSEFITETLNIFDNNIDLLYNCRKGKIINDVEGKRYIDNFKYINLLASNKGWNKDLDLSIPYNKEIDNIYNPKNLYTRLIKYDEITRNRLMLVGKAINKINTTIEILKIVKDYKSLIFSAYIEIAENIKELANTKIRNDFCLSYHSKLKTIVTLDKNTNKIVKKGEIKQKAEIIDKFKNEDTNAISAVGALNDSLNIPEIEVCIITAGTVNPIQETQRRGRSVRIKENKKFAFIFNIVAINTIDEKKFINRIGYKPTYISLDNIKENMKKYEKNS